MNKYPAAEVLLTLRLHSFRGALLFSHPPSKFEVHLRGDAAGDSCAT